jgi:hypothetical protein
MARRTLAGVRRLLIAVILSAIAGCNSSSSDQPRKADPLHTYNGRVIRGWLLSLERQDYEQAAYYFAPHALIDQGHPYRLASKSEAFAFNASLPCRADLIRLEGGGHAHHVLATFRLRKGPGGPCSGLVKVRYTIRKGKFTEWHQLPNVRPRAREA